MSFARNVVTVAGATSLSRLLGFARDTMIAAVFGAGAHADAFFIAFQLPNLARRLLAEGALNAALVPLYLRARDAGGESGAAAFAGRIAATGIIALAAAALLAALAMPLIVSLLAPGFPAGGERFAGAVAFGRLMLPYIVLAAPLVVLIGVLNANDRYGTPALAAVTFNVALIVVLAFLAAMKLAGELSGAILAGGVVLAGMAQLLVLLAALARRRGSIAPLRPSAGADMRRFAALALPGLVAGGIPQLIVIAGIMVASSAPGAVSWIYYANRLVELPLGIVGIAVGTVLVPTLAGAARRGDGAGLAASRGKGIVLGLGLALPAAIGLALLALPIVRILFERGAFTSADTAATAAALAAFALGLPGHVLVKCLAPAFFAREDTLTPMYAALAGFAVALAGALVLHRPFGHVGIAAAIALSGWTVAAVLAFLGRKRGPMLDPAARRQLPRIVLAAAGMGLALAGGLHVARPFADPEGARAAVALVLAGFVAFGAGLYVALLLALGAMRPADFAAALRRGP